MKMNKNHSSPSPLTPILDPWTPGAEPQTPVIGSRSANPGSDTAADEIILTNVKCIYGCTMIQNVMSCTRLFTGLQRTLTRYDTMQ